MKLIIFHTIIRDKEEKTKTRVVFDASRNSRKAGSSLNDILHAVPPFKIFLFDVVFKFRPYSYAIVSRIEKAFLQISLAEQHRDYTRFIWFKNVSKIN